MRHLQNLMISLSYVVICNKLKVNQFELLLYIWTIVELYTVYSYIQLNNSLNYARIHVSITFSYSFQLCRIVFVDITAKWYFDTVDELWWYSYELYILVVIYCKTKGKEKCKRWSKKIEKSPKLKKVNFIKRNDKFIYLHTDRFRRTWLFKTLILFVTVKSQVIWRNRSVLK